MKTRKLMLFAAFTAAVSVGCTALEPYTIDAPEDLQDKIQEYADEKAANQSDAYTEIDITATLVGAEDNSSAWWSEFSQYFAVPSGKKLFLEFENYGSGANNWNNWNVCVSNGERDTDGYSEYFVLRSDWYGWGNSDYNASVIEFDYGGGEVNWDEFREKMQGAYVTLSLDHAKAGAAYLEVQNVATDGFTIVEKYNQAVSATDDVNVFLIADGSHFLMKKAYLVPSEISEIPDYPAVGFQLTNTPSTVALGQEDYWGETVATVVYEDGFSAVVPKEDLYIVEPDMSTVGTKTVVVTYAKTKLGKAGDPVSAYYNFEVTDFASIEVRQLPVTTTYYVFDQAVPFYSEGLEVVGVKADGSTSVIDNSALEFGMVQPVAGAQDVEISFSGYTTTCPVTVKVGTEGFGAPDYTNAWWTTFLSADKPVAAGESVTLHMFLYSDNLENYHSPCTILRRADLSEFAVVRMDNYGWGGGYGTAVLESDWNFDVFAANQSMSAVSITVTNNGDGTADVNYSVTYANGETHFQKYSGITVDSADLQVGIVTEESYVIILDQPAVEAKFTGISAVATANLIGGAEYVTLSPSAIKVTANYSDGSTTIVNNDNVQISFTDDKVVYKVAAGETVQGVATVKYTPAGGEEVSASANLVVKATTLPVTTKEVGAADYSNGWWTTFSDQWNVPSGESVTASMTLRSAALFNHQCTCTILRQADNTEFAVVRMDNYGWLYATNTFDSLSVLGWSLACDWNWDNYLAGLDNSKVVVTVANGGNGKGSIRYYVVYQNGETHFQYYDNISVNSEDLNMAFVNEASQLIFD